MKINSIYIKSLFGIFNYQIEMVDYANPLIITGLNGYGKTTILTIIDRLSANDLFYFYSLPFTAILISFDDATSIKITSLEEESEGDVNADSNLTKSRIVKFEWIKEKQVESSLQLDKKSIKDAVRQLGFYRRTEFDSSNYASDTFYQFVKSNSYIYNYFRKREESSALFLVLDGLKSTFIHAQRIIVEKRDEEERFGRNTVKYVSKITEVSELLQKLLNGQKLSYLVNSQSVDGRIITNLLETKSYLKKEEYEVLKSEVEKKIAELMCFGLIEKTVIRPYETDASHAHILTVYLNNLNEKLKIFDTILPKIRLFSKLVSSLKFVNKSISYSPAKGLVIKTGDGMFLDVSKLSSGEQNEIIMLYYMIFEVQDNTILLLDEPEISLHVAWQNDFMNNLQQIAENKNLQVVVATHSPQIIGNRWNECYDLCEQMRL